MPYGDYSQVTTEDFDLVASRHPTFSSTNCCADLHRSCTD
jgi:hypothetical protein